MHAGRINWVWGFREHTGKQDCFATHTNWNAETAYGGQRERLAAKDPPVSYDLFIASA